MRPITTPTLTLEPQTVGHAAAMFVLLSDPAIYAYGNSAPTSLAWLQQRFERLSSRRSPDCRERWLNWVIRLPDAQVAGYVQATIDERGQATVGYELGSDFWGRGLGTQAVAAMIDELIGHYRVKALRATLDPANQRSMRLLLRLGFVRDRPTAGEAANMTAGDCLMRRAVG